MCASRITGRWCATSRCCAASAPRDRGRCPPPTPEGALPRAMSDDQPRTSEPAGCWSIERDADGIAWLTLDKPATSANVLSGSVLVELDALLASLERQLPRAL